MRIKKIQIVYQIIWKVSLKIIKKTQTVNNNPKNKKK